MLFYWSCKNVAVTFTADIHRTTCGGEKVFLERKHHLELLLDIAGNIERTRGQIILVNGEAGIGRPLT